VDYLRRSEICSFEELLFIAQAGLRLGIDKIRLTGGEVFLRRGIVTFLKELKALEGLREIGITTNGTMLLPYLEVLKEIGIENLNISLDTLSERLFYELTGSRRFFEVLEAINRAVEEGFKVKVNTVIIRGKNDGEIHSFIQHFLKKSVEVRFIEFMPLCGPNWKAYSLFPYEEIVETIDRAFDLFPLPSSGTAKEFFLSDGTGLMGRVGIIAAVTHSFCGACSRLRLSANGELRPCLFSRKKVELLPILRSGLSAEEKQRALRRAFQEAVQVKPKSKPVHYESCGVQIRRIGG
jgi:cyclic pyranopterin phosphate synthase